MTLRWPIDDTIGVAACTLIPLSIVDAAFEHGGGADRRFMVEEVCPKCPSEVQARCLEYAVVTGEPGVWGGTTGNIRTRALKRAH